MPLQQETLHRLNGVASRLEEITHRLQEPAVVQDHTQYRSLMKEYDRLVPVVEAYKAYGRAQDAAEEAKALIDFAVQQYGHLDILVNNAGISQIKLFTDITPEEWRQMFAANVDGIYHCCRAAVPYLVQQHSGTIINVSSIWGLCGASCEVHYSASKAAVIGFTQALAKELAPSGITVNCVAPGAIDTEMNAHLTAEERRMLEEEIPLGRMGSPEEVAAAIAFLAGEDARYFTGQVLSPNGGIVI